MMQLSEELTSTENRVAFARQAYNDSVMGYNNRRQAFPGSVIAGMFHFGPAAQWEIDPGPPGDPRGPEGAVLSPRRELLRAAAGRPRHDRCGWSLLFAAGGGLDRRRRRRHRRSRSTATRPASTIARRRDRGLRGHAADHRGRHR